MVVFVLFSWSSCIPREPASDGGAESGTSTRSRDEAEESADEPRGEQRTTLEPSSEATDASARSGDGEETGSGEAQQGWPHHSRARVLPEDVEIGELEDLPAASSARVEAIGTIRELFVELSQDRIPQDLLVPESREALDNRLDYMLERARISSEVRIGAVEQLGGSEYRVPLVAFGVEGGRTTGEISVAKREGSWYILDVLVDFSRIAEDSQTPIFDPGDASPTLLNF